MPAAIAVVLNSPVFTPRPRATPVFCKPSTLLSPSPLSPALSPSSLSPFASFLLQKQPSTFVNYSIDDRYGSKSNDRNEPIVCSVSSPSKTAATLLKRKRPTRIEVPIAPVTLGLDSGNRNPGEAESLNEVEDEGEGYAVYCKRGKKRGAMEDRHSAVVGFLGDSKKVYIKNAFIYNFDFTEFYIESYVTKSCN